MDSAAREKPAREAKQSSPPRPKLGVSNLIDRLAEIALLDLHVIICGRRDAATLFSAYVVEHEDIAVTSC